MKDKVYRCPGTEAGCDCAAIWRRANPDKVMVSIPLSLLERLAPEQFPWTRTGACPYCKKNVLDPDEGPHFNDCPWLEARRLIEEVKGA